MYSKERYLPVELAVFSVVNSKPEGEKVVKKKKPNKLEILFVVHGEILVY